jgi:hypothetical protein
MIRAAFCPAVPARRPRRSATAASPSRTDPSNAAARLGLQDRSASCVRRGGSAGRGVTVSSATDAGSTRPRPIRRDRGLVSGGRARVRGRWERGAGRSAAGRSSLVRSTSAGGTPPARSALPPRATSREGRTARCDLRRARGAAAVLERGLAATGAAAGLWAVAGVATAGRAAAGGDAAATGAAARSSATAGGTGAGAASPGAARSGRSSSGSTYPSGSPVRRTPRWTYGWSCSDSPLSPSVPSCSPSATDAPRATPSEPRWSSVTVNPSPVSIVIERPCSGSVPAKRTSPPAGASTGSPASPAMSTPRCAPASYSPGASTNGRRTVPEAGQLHASADGEAASAAATAATVTANLCVATCENMRPP